MTKTRTKRKCGIFIKITNGFTKGDERLSGLMSKYPESALWKHCMLEHEKHENEQADFFIKVLGSFQSSMTRQVKKRVRI